MRRPQKRLDESHEEYRERMAPWDVMTSAGTEVKRARSTVDDSLATVRRYERNPKLPESQRWRVEHWRWRLETALAHLDTIDVDGWKTELYGEGK